MSDLFWENKLRRTSRREMPRRFHKYLYNTCSTQLRVHRLVLGVSGGWRLSGRLDHHLGLTKARRDHSRAFVCQGFQHTTSSQPLGEMIELLARFLQKVLTMGTTSTEQRKIAIPRRCPLKISSLVGATMASDVLGLGCLPPYLPGSTPQQLGHRIGKASARPCRAAGVYTPAQASAIPQRPRSGSRSLQPQIRPNHLSDCW